MIYRKGEYIRILSGSWTRLGIDIKERIINKVGQICKVGDIDNSEYCYVVITVIDDETVKVLVKPEEITLLTLQSPEEQYETDQFRNKVIK